jgi:hypothetical protein
MKILQSSLIDPLYRKYGIHRELWRYGELHISISQNLRPSYAQIIPSVSAVKHHKESVLYIESLEWKWVWHELMILLLCEAYYERIKYITLAVNTRDPEIISQESLVSFYRGFWFEFTSILIENGFDYKPYASYSNHMTLFRWSWLVEQVRRYIQSIHLGSKLK